MPKVQESRAAIQGRRERIEPGLQWFADWSVLPADALKRLVICNRIIRPTSRTIDRSIPLLLPPPPPHRSLSDVRLPHRDVAPFLRECRDREKPARTVCEARRTGRIISVRGKSDFYLGPVFRLPRHPPLFASVSPSALFLSRHIRMYKIFREFFRKSPESASVERSSEHRKSIGRGEARWKENYCWLSESRPTSRARYIFRLLLSYRSFHRFEENLSVRRLFCLHAR